MEIELERRFLISEIPDDFIDPKEERVVDHYIPISSDHCQVRIRCQGEKREFTKKSPVNEDDLSTMMEINVPLSKEEYDALMQVPGRTVSKFRIRTLVQCAIAEFGRFEDELEGLKLLDIEFQNEQDMKRFKTPSYIVAEVTNDKRFAGGELCGKTFEDIKPALAEYGAF